MRPKAKTESLLIEEFAGEAVVYDLDSDLVHRLDRRAYQVWRSCDGRRSIEMIASAMKEEQQSEHPASDHLAVVQAAVHQLQEAGLLLSAGEKETSAKRMPTRRDLLAKAGTVGAAAGGLILVHSIAAPTPAMAASVERQSEDGCKWVQQTNGTWLCTNSRAGVQCIVEHNNVSLCKPK